MNHAILEHERRHVIRPWKTMAAFALRVMHVRVKGMSMNGLTVVKKPHVNQAPSLPCMCTY